MQSTLGCAVIFAGSGSDKGHIDKIVMSLQKYEVPHDVRICSGHKQPCKLIELIREYNEVGGLVTYVAVAGGTDALSGTLSYHARGLVISCPPDSRPDEGIHNQSCLNNPSGSSNVYIARPENVGRVIAQNYSGVNSRFRELLEKEIAAKVKKLEMADDEFQANYGERG